VEQAQGATENVAFSTHPEVGLQGVPGADLCAFGTMRPPAHPATPPGAHQKNSQQHGHRPVLTLACQTLDAAEFGAYGPIGDEE